MIGYVTVGTNDLERAKAFYDALFATISGKRVFDSPQGVVWSLSRISPGFGVFIPHDGKPATTCNGSMVALAMLSKKHVDDFYAKAIMLGGTDEVSAITMHAFISTIFMTWTATNSAPITWRSDVPSAARIRLGARGCRASFQMQFLHQPVSDAVPCRRQGSEC